jgi:hypothetical protein
LPTAISNILAAYLLAHHTWQPASSLLLLIGCSSCLFLSGMILNDVFDYEIDRLQRPQRPLPSGQISVRQAAAAGFSLLLIAMVLAGLVSMQFQSLKPLVVAFSLAIGVLMYNGVLKGTMLSPVIMGSCRSLNFLLGASTAASTGQADSFAGFTIPIEWIAFSLGIYIAGVTLFAQKETSEKQNRMRLAVAACMVILGIVGFAILPIVDQEDLVKNERLGQIYPLLILLISLPIVRRLLNGIFTPQPSTVTAAVIVSLRSIIVLDAAICAFAATASMVYALVVISLLVPGLLLSRVVSQT